MCKCGELNPCCHPSTGGETDYNQSDGRSVVAIFLPLATVGFCSGAVVRHCAGDSCCVVVLWRFSLAFFLCLFSSAGAPRACVRTLSASGVWAI